MITTVKTWALAPVMILSIAACSGDEVDVSGKSNGAASSSSKTLSTSIGDASDLETLDAMIENAGLADVLQGKGPYTVFAPVDAALDGLGADLSADAMKAQSAALLRAHIVPGTLTLTDIMVAIDRAGGGVVQMRTMADSMLTFSRDGGVVVVTTADGATVRLAGQEVVATNGVIHPIEGVLVVSS